MRIALDRDPDRYGDQSAVAHASLRDHMLGKIPDVDYFYASQLANETAPVYDVRCHPVEPLSARLTLGFTF